MTINNTYVLDVDLKRQMTTRTPKFRKGDEAILIFKMFDDGEEYDINSVTKAEIIHKTSQGTIIESNCDFIQFEGKRAIRYRYDKDAMTETGTNETMLIVYEGDRKVSVQPFSVIIYDLNGTSSSFIALIQDLQNKINNLVMDLNQTIKLAEKGRPNGVATLDASGRIPESQMPTQIREYFKHIYHTVWANQVHGLRITRPEDDGIGGNLQYDTDNNNWQNVGFPPDAVGGGGSSLPILDVEITKGNSIVTLIYKGTPTVQLQKWDYGERDKAYFLSNGTTFTGTTITVDRIGLYTLYYKDSNGTEYARVFNITTSDLLRPTINVDVNNGDVTVTISTPTSIKKWAKGQRDIGYFQSQGNVFTGNTFTVTEVGWYTIYYKTTAGVEYTYEFEVNYAQLNGSLPIVTMSDSYDTNFDSKFRTFRIGINDSRVTMVKFTGRNTSIGTSDYSYVIADNGYYYANGSSGFVDVTSVNHDMTVEFMDNNNVVYGTAVHKCRANYNYFVVNNQYISLTRIKNSTTNYTLPTTIEGLPVLDAGCVFFTNDTQYDNWYTKNLTIPSSILCGGRFAIYTANSTVAIESIRIENTDFKFNIPNRFDIFIRNSPSGITIYVPANSETYNTVSNKTSVDYTQVQTFQ